MFIPEYETSGTVLDPDSELELDMAEKEAKSQEKKLKNAENAVAAAKEALDNGVVVPESDKDTRGNFSEKEHELLGIYISSHPMSQFAFLYQNMEARTIASLTTGRVTIAGVMTNVRKTKRKSDGAGMAFCDIEDMTGSIHVNCFANAYRDHEGCFTEGMTVKAEGTVRIEEKGEHREKVFVIRDITIIG